VQPTTPAIKAIMIKKMLGIATSRCILEPNGMFMLDFLYCIDQDCCG